MKLRRGSHRLCCGPWDLKEGIGAERGKPARRAVNGGELGALGMRFMELGFALLCNMG